MKKFFILSLILLGQNTFALPIKDWKLSTQGLGPIKINMTLNEAAKATDKTFTNLGPNKNEGENDSCFTTMLKGKELDDLSFMVSGGKIVRIDVHSNKFATSRNAKVGDTEERVKTLYNDKLEVTSHKYEEKGHYLTYFDKPRQRAIRFETDGQKIERIYAGNSKEVQYVEGCA